VFLYIVGISHAIVTENGETSEENFYDDYGWSLQWISLKIEIICKIWILMKNYLLSNLTVSNIFVNPTIRLGWNLMKSLLIYLSILY
jgi:hypothetical protein